MTKITIQDQVATGKVIQEFMFEVSTPRMTVRDLIRNRVHEEVALYNFSHPGYFKGLIQPTDAEATLNGYKIRQTREVSWEKQANVAIEAFEQNGFFILVDNHQVENLDDVIEIKEDTQISFIKLIPLIGG